MIVNSNMEQTHVDPPPLQATQPPPATTIVTSTSSGDEHFYLKRKHDDLNDSLDNCNYIQPKKRHIIQHNEQQMQQQQQQQQQHQSHHQYIVADENYQNLANSQAPTDSQQCDLQFSLNNSNFINCHTIEFLSYDNDLQPLPTATSVYSTSVSADGANAVDHFDSSQWHNSDLLELDQRYNSVSHCFDKVQHTANQIQRNDSILYHHHHQHHNHSQPQQQSNSQLGQSQSSQQSQQDPHQLQQHMVTTHHPNNCDSSNQHQIQHHVEHGFQQQHQQQSLLSNSMSSMQMDTQINLNDQQRHVTKDKSMDKSADPEADFEDKNLSWLFNFRLDELPHLSPDVQNNQKSAVPSLTSAINGSQPQPHNKTVNSSNSSNHRAMQSKTGKKVDELIKELTAEITEDGDMIVAENIIVENSPSPLKGPKKPPFTYTELIEYALEERGELTVSGIYQWISDRFPYYKSNDDRWKNSVRHNLSINPHFRKGLKAPQGAGHLWTISSRDSEENALAWEHKKQRLELFFKMEQMHNQRQSSLGQQDSDDTQLNSFGAMDETATAVQHITQQMQNDCISSTEVNLNHQSPLHEQSISASCLPGMLHGNDLKKSAGEILNGVRRTVEVQPINCRSISTYHDSILETEDYLNPIIKDEDIIAHDGSFRSEFYITEIDPIELGINISTSEEEVLFSEDFNLNYFGISSASDIVA